MRRYRLFMRKLSHQQGSASYLASSVALGVLLAFVVPEGLQMLAAAALATLLGCNRWVAMSAVWITNPITIPFIYAGAYIVGALVTGMSIFDGERPGDWWHDLTTPENAGEVLISLIVGLLILGTISSIVSYFTVHRTLTRYGPRRSSP
jgi:uncharacterized protein (DUF2062 family)